MTKEDKQIIDRAVKENWRIGDRSRLKRLLEKNLEQYRDIAELERENRLLGERCNQLLKDKGNLTDQIADIKANCDLAIEGRDIKIKELEQELTVQKDQLQEEINLHLHAENYIKSLEQQIEKLIDFVLSKTEYCDVCPKTDTCINSEGTCPYAGILAKKGEEDVTREWLMQFISRR